MFTTTVSTKAFDESLRQAKARLSDMHVQEVSLVDAAANLRRWVVVKGLGMTVEINKGLKLPPAALKALKEGVAKELTQLVKLAEVLNTCEADDKASVPAELGKFLAASSLSIAGLAKQYGGDVEVPQGTEQATQKRGAKISAKRLAALKSAHESIGSVIAGADPAYIAEKAAKPPKIDDEEDEDTAKSTGKKPEEDKSGDMQKAIDAAVEAGVKKALAEVEKKTAQQGEELAKANVEIAKLRGQTPAPASQPIDAQADDGNKVIWGSDLAAEVQKRKQK